MSKEYVIENTGRAISFLKIYMNTETSIRMTQGDYYDLGELTEKEIKYYRQLSAIGLHLLEKKEFNNSHDVTLEYETEEEVDSEEDEIDDSEENNEDEEVDSEEEDIEEEVVEDNEDDEDIEIPEKDELLEKEFTKEGLEELSEEELRALGEELEVGNYWNKKEENIIEEILEIVNSEE